jgi:hypothetical protein
MIHNLKALGLALVAVFAMSAMAIPIASAATPGEFTVTAPSNGTGTEIAGKINALTAFGQGVECPGSTYHQRKYFATPHEPVPNAVTDITVTWTANNSSCKTTSGLKATVNMNGCDTVWHIGETIIPGLTYNLTHDVACPFNKEIDIEIYASASNENIKACTLKIKSQSGLAGLKITNGTSGGKSDITTEGTIKNIHVEESGLCGNATTNVGEFHMALTSTGKDALGSPTGLSITD